MIYFGYPLDIHGWKTKTETNPDRFRGLEPENRGWKTTTKTKTARPETHGYPNQNRLAAILTLTASASHMTCGGCAVHVRLRLVLPKFGPFDFFFVLSTVVFFLFSKYCLIID
jgi:hypothetical protein